MMGARQDVVTDVECDNVSSSFYGVNRCAYFQGLNQENPEEPLEHPWRTVLTEFSGAEASPTRDFCPYGCPVSNVFSGNETNQDSEYSVTTFLGSYPGDIDISNNRCIIRTAWPYVADFSETIGETDLTRLRNNANLISTVDLVNGCF